MKKILDNKIFLYCEICVIFIFLPLSFVTKMLPNSFMMILLLIVFIYCSVILNIYKINFFKLDLKKDMIPMLIVRFIIISIFLYIFTYFYDAQKLFYFPKNYTFLWIAVMIIYPIFSAFTQEVIFRKFFFFRYEKIFQNFLIPVSAISFSYMHIVFQNNIAIIFTFISGLIFSYIYQKTKSINLVSLEHALYGNMIFTIGLGEYFYHANAT